MARSYRPKVQSEPMDMAVWELFRAAADYVDDRGRTKFEAYCPIHETPGKSKPSGEIILNDGKGKQLWYCQVCAPSGQRAFLDHIYPEVIAREDFETIKSGGVVTSISRGPARKQGTKSERPALTDDMIAKMADELQKHRDLLQYVKERRGITARTLKRFNIGWYGSLQAFVIPIYNPDGSLYNAKIAYKDSRTVNGKPVKYAWWSDTRGTRPPLMFEHLLPESEYEVVVVEGEWDAALARQMGFNSVTPTRGAKKWTNEDSNAMDGHEVVILMDNDKAGREGANVIQASLRKTKTARGFKVVNHEAVNHDFVDMHVKQGWGRPDFRALIDAEPLTLIRAEVSDLPVTGRRVPFSALTSRNSALDVVESTVMVNARVGHSKLPWRGEIDCGGDAGAAKCGVCPINGINHRDMDLNRMDRDTYLPMIDVDDLKVKKHVGKLYGLRCNNFEITPSKDIDVEHLFVTSPSVSAEDEEDANTGKVVTVYLVGSHDSESGDVIKVVGRCESEAKKQGAVFMAWHKEDDNPLAERKELTPEEFDLLSIFQTPDDVSVYDHALDIARSINEQYSVLGRDEMTLAYLLTYSSVLDFNYRGKVQHGWVQGMVAGDTRTGKTLIADRLLEHIGYGAMIKCDVSSRAGLVGGQGTHNGNTYLKMGKLPRSDRQLAFLDEATNLMDNGEIMKQLTDMRSSGTMSINLIDGGNFRARVRQVWISNPPEGKTIMRFPNRGIDAIAQLVGSQQDLARFDWITAVANDELLGRQINSMRSNEIHRNSAWTPELWRVLIPWIWTRRPEDIAISTRVLDYIGKVAERISARYANERYLVIPGTEAGIKIARMAVAFAALKFSTDDGHKIIVTKHHVDAVEQFMDAMLGADDLGLADYCADQADLTERAEDSIDWFVYQVEQSKDYHNAAYWLAGQANGFRKEEFERNVAAMDPAAMLTVLQSRSLIITSNTRLEASPTLRDTLASLKKQRKITSLRTSDGNDS